MTFCLGLCVAKILNGANNQWLVCPWEFILASGQEMAAFKMWWQLLFQYFAKNPMCSHVFY